MRCALSLLEAIAGFTQQHFQELDELTDEILGWRRSLLTADERRRWARRPRVVAAFDSIEALAQALD